MKKFITALTALFLFAGCAFAAPDAAGLKKMSTFLSNFTEQGFFNFDIKQTAATTLCTWAIPHRPT